MQKNNESFLYAMLSLHDNFISEFFIYVRNDPARNCVKE
jgi:hypothetical protein